MPPHDTVDDVEEPAAPASSPPGEARRNSEATEPPGEVAAIRADAVTKSFGGVAAVDGASLTVGDGEIVALLGPSGSGKTTLLRVIAGFERPDAGSVRVGGLEVTGPGTWVEPERRRVGMVFQQGALFPHLTVEGNVGFGTSRPERVRECLRLVALEDRAGSFPHELSGGERQRVALARALAPDPEVVLLDEPFAALDAGLRQALREEVASILRAAGTSALLVTHDQDEALSFADNVAIMRGGRFVQVGSPRDVYASPVDRTTAGVLGDLVVLPGQGDGREVRTALGTLALADPATGPVDVVLRPEQVVVGPPGSGACDAVVGSVDYFGHDAVVRLLPQGGSPGDPPVLSRVMGDVALAPGQLVGVGVRGAVCAFATTPGPTTADAGATDR
jgi:iron(III) transport system ATP-binding protein